MYSKAFQTCLKELIWPIYLFSLLWSFHFDLFMHLFINLLKIFFIIYFFKKFSHQMSAYFCVTIFLSLCEQFENIRISTIKVFMFFQFPYDTQVLLPLCSRENDFRNFTPFTGQSLIRCRIAKNITFIFYFKNSLLLFLCRSIFASILFFYLTWFII